MDVCFPCFPLTGNVASSDGAVSSQCLNNIYLDLTVICCFVFFPSYITICIYNIYLFSDRDIIDIYIYIIIYIYIYILDSFTFSDWFPSLPVRQVKAAAI
jgi:hypothetical protein